MSEEVFYDYMTQAVPEGFVFRVGAPPQGAVQSLQRIAEAGNAIHISTARLHVKGVDHLVRAATVEWLSEWQVPYSSLTFDTNK